MSEREPEPRTPAWEVPVALACLVILVLALGVHAGRALANLMAGAGWTAPSRVDLIASVPAVLGGDAAAGLADPPPVVAGPVAVRIWVTVAELAMFTAAGLAAVRAGRWWSGRSGQLGSGATDSGATGSGPRSVGPMTSDIGLDPASGMAGDTGAHRTQASLVGRRRLRRTASGDRPDLTGRRHPPTELGWRLGRAQHPLGGELWVPWDRTVGVIGSAGTGTTSSVVLQAVLAAPGAALVTATSIDDLLLIVAARATARSTGRAMRRSTGRSDRRSNTAPTPEPAGRRQVFVVDPVGAAHGTDAFVAVDLGSAAVEHLAWDPLAGCVGPMVAERRARAFMAGTQNGAHSAGLTHDEGRSGGTDAALVLQAFLHAAALTGRGLDEVLSWAADPLAATTPAQVLAGHPHAAPLWDTLLHGALHGPERSVAAAVATVQQALSVLFHEPVRRRLLPGPHRPATDLAEVIAGGGTICLLARDDPYVSASPLLTALAEDVLNAATAAAKASPWGRLCPPMLAALDDLPATVPLPTLRARFCCESQMSRADGAGVAFVWTAPSRDQLSTAFGEAEARALVGLTSAVAVLGEGPDRLATVTAQGGGQVVVRLARCQDGAAGRLMLADRDQARDRLRESTEQRRSVSPAARSTAAVVAAHRHGLIGASSAKGAQRPNAVLGPTIPGPTNAAPTTPALTTPGPVPGPSIPVRAPAAGSAPEAAVGPPQLLLIDGGLNEED